MAGNVLPHSAFLLFIEKPTLTCGSTEEDKTKELEGLESQLNEVERKHSLVRRWLPSDREYKKHEYALLFTKKEQLLVQLWKTGQRRLFLIKLKRKYADDQKIAKKLSLQISKETKQIRSLLEGYNVCVPPASESCDTLTLSEALDSSSVGMRLQQLGSWGTISSGRRREIIETYFTLCRSNEEIAMLEEDAGNIVSYYENKKEVITTELHRLSSASDSFSRGATALLSGLLDDTSQLLTESKNTAKVISSRSHQQQTDDYGETDSSSCEDSSDLDMEVY